MSIANQRILFNLNHPEDESLDLAYVTRALEIYCDECYDCEECGFREDSGRCTFGDAKSMGSYDSLLKLYRKVYQLYEYEKGLNNPFLEEEPQEDQPTEDLVNHPSHYTHGGMECIDEMLMIFGREAVMHFCVCNAWKYRKRALYKNGEQDQQKSDWYLQKYKELKYGTEQPEPM